LNLEFKQLEVVMGMNSLNLEGIPEPIARGLEVVAEMARVMSKFQENPAKSDAILELPSWPLGVIGELGREEIYNDYGCRS
jgi:hypothetical protein